MTGLRTGTETLHTRVEGWECDFNGHWNTRFYGRAFQKAAEVVAALSGDADAAHLVAPRRHVRFHKEMRSGEPITIRSFNMDGRGVAHLLCSGDLIAATALDPEAPHSTQLNELPDELARRVMPRGLTGRMPDRWLPDDERDRVVELGAVDAGDLHTDGTLRLDPLMARMAIASHHHAMSIGYTLDFTARTGVGRMLAEMRHVMLGRCEPGTFLRGMSRITGAKGKSYITVHLICTHAGDPLALFELGTLAVDMTERRATDLPQIVHAALT